MTTTNEDNSLTHITKCCGGVYLSNALLLLLVQLLS
jgi:hypothetical protein